MARAPAFQMYAATRLADRTFKLMSLDERGLLHTMELEVWANGTVPADPGALARVLGLDPREVADALSTRVLGHFERVGDDLIHPELKAYREKLENFHRKKVESGEEGARRRWRKPRTPDGTPDGTPNGTPNGDANGTLRQDQTSQDQTVYRKNHEHDEFVRELRAGEPEFLERDR